jgi:hypothetical protein
MKKILKGVKLDPCTASNFVECEMLGLLGYTPEQGNLEKSLANMFDFGLESCFEYDRWPF